MGNAVSNADERAVAAAAAAGTRSHASLDESSLVSDSIVQTRTARAEGKPLPKATSPRILHPPGVMMDRNTKSNPEGATHHATMDGIWLQPSDSMYSESDKYAPYRTLTAEKLRKHKFHPHFLSESDEEAEEEDGAGDSLAAETEAAFTAEATRAPTRAKNTAESYLHHLHDHHQQQHASVPEYDTPVTSLEEIEMIADSNLSQGEEEDENLNQFGTKQESDDDEVSTVNSASVSHDFRRRPLALTSEEKKLEEDVELEENENFEEDFEEKFDRSLADEDDDGDEKGGIVENDQREEYLHRAGRGDENFNERNNDEDTGDDEQDEEINDVSPITSDIETLATQQLKEDNKHIEIINLEDLDEELIESLTRGSPNGKVEQVLRTAQQKKIDDEGLEQLNLRRDSNSNRQSRGSSRSRSRRSLSRKRSQSRSRSNSRSITRQSKSREVAAETTFAPGTSDSSYPERSSSSGSAKKTRGPRVSATSRDQVLVETVTHESTVDSRGKSVIKSKSKGDGSAAEDAITLFDYCEEAMPSKQNNGSNFSRTKRGEGSQSSGQKSLRKPLLDSKISVESSGSSKTSIEPKKRIENVDSNMDFNSEGAVTRDMLDVKSSCIEKVVSQQDFDSEGAVTKETLLSVDHGDERYTEETIESLRLMVSSKSSDMNIGYGRYSPAPRHSSDDAAEIMQRSPENDLPANALPKLPATKQLTKLPVTKPLTTLCSISGQCNEQILSGHELSQNLRSQSAACSQQARTKCSTGMKDSGKKCSDDAKTIAAITSAAASTCQPNEFPQMELYGVSRDSFENPSLEGSFRVQSVASSLAKGNGKKWAQNQLYRQLGNVLGSTNSTPRTVDEQMVLGMYNRTLVDRASEDEVSTLDTVEVARQLEERRQRAIKESNFHSLADHTTMSETDTPLPSESDESGHAHMRPRLAKESPVSRKAVMQTNRDVQTDFGYATSPPVLSPRDVSLMDDATACSMSSAGWNDDRAPRTLANIPETEGPAEDFEEKSDDKIENLRRNGSPNDDESRVLRLKPTESAEFSGKRDPRGLKERFGSFEGRVDDSALPEDRLAKNIVNARLRQALGLTPDVPFSYDSNLENVPSLHVQTTEALGSFDEADFSFVQKYESAFDAFMQQNLGLMAKNPKMIYNLRVAKLQKLLQATMDAEQEVKDETEAVEQHKNAIIAAYQQHLIDAARRKAALEIHLKHELNTIWQATAVMKAKLTWQIILKNERRAKRLYDLITQLSREKAKDRASLLKLLPDHLAMQSIRDAVTAPAGATRLTEEQEKDLRQFQVDNAFMKAEVEMLEKKLAAQQAAGKKYAWVDAVLVRMDEPQLKNLKQRYQKKVEATF